MLCGTNGAVAAMDRAYMSLRARKPNANKTVGFSFVMCSASIVTDFLVYL